ncbi:hypothetical protein SDC9_160098 [bioreactor metagenome]|uniref:Uncharacterized protein n=1 Tax=bioreactor metagenome TaxID=1076179 RepID=A0A645FEF5_9ZZZZ
MDDDIAVDHGIFQIQINASEYGIDTGAVKTFVLQIDLLGAEGRRVFGKAVFAHGSRNPRLFTDQVPKQHAYSNPDQNGREYQRADRFPGDDVLRRGKQGQADGDPKDISSVESVLQGAKQAGNDDEQGPPSVEKEIEIPEVQGISGPSDAK